MSGSTGIHHTSDDSHKGGFKESADDINPAQNQSSEKKELDAIHGDDDDVRPDGPRLEKSASNVLHRIASRVTTKSLRDPGPPPDGGLKAWTQCAMAWLVCFNTWGYVNAFGAFQTYYSSTLDETPSTISWIGSIQVWILFFLAAFSGRALDAGLFVPAFVIGAVVQVVGIFTTSLATKYWHLVLTQGVCTGIGGGIMFCPAMALLSTYFSTHRGVAVSLATTGNSVGGALYPLMVQQLLPRIGFGWTIRVLGFLNLTSFAVAFAFMRPRLPPRKSGPLIDWSAFLEIDYMLLVIGMCFEMAATYFCNYYIASYGREAMGLSYSSSIVLLIVMNAAGIISRIAAGYLADRFFGVFNTFIPLLVLVTILMYCWIAVADEASLYVFACFIGLAINAFQSLFPTSVASMTKDLQKTGTRLGMGFSIISFAALLGPPIGGALLSADNGGYLGAQIWAATTSFVGLGLITAARVYRYGPSMKLKC
ncbi:hypothetical protein MBLNU459_g6688t2 [Dothideomycetes sp. NU459]